MSIPKNIKSYLDQNKVSYKVLKHATVYTSMETAEKQAVPGKEFVKCVVIKNKSDYALAALPSTCKVDLPKLSAATKENSLTVAKEIDFSTLFPECDLGAMPPLGELYHMPVWVDKKLAEDEYIVFNAGNHTETIRMKFDDFKKLTHPKIIDFAKAA